MRALRPSPSVDGHPEFEPYQLDERARTNHPRCSLLLCAGYHESGSPKGLDPEAQGRLLRVIPPHGDVIRSLYPMVLEKVGDWDTPCRLRNDAKERGPVAWKQVRAECHVLGANPVDGART